MLRRCYSMRRLLCLQRFGSHAPVTWPRVEPLASHYRRGSSPSQVTITTLAVTLTRTPPNHWILHDHASSSSGAPSPGYGGKPQAFPQRTCFSFSKAFLMILGFSGGIRGSANARRSLYDVPTVIAPVPRGGSCDNDFSRYFSVRALLGFSCSGAAMADTR